MVTHDQDIITTPVAEFCRLSGLGRSKVYELLGDGTLDSITIGKRRLIVLASYHRLVESRVSAVTPNVTGRSSRRRLSE